MQGGGGRGGGGGGRGRKYRKKKGEGGRMEGLILSTKMIFMMQLPSKRMLPICRYVSFFFILAFFNDFGGIDNA